MKKRKNLTVIALIVCIVTVSMTDVFSNTIQENVEQNNYVQLNPDCESPNCTESERTYQALISDDISLNEFEYEVVNSMPLAVTWYTTISNAGKYMRENLVERKSIIQINYKTKNPDFKSLAENIFKEAIKETGQENEGDYIYWHLRRYVANCSGYSTNNNSGTTYYYKFVFTFDYNTTLEQEKEVTSKINEIYNSFNFTDKTSVYDRVKKIYSYMCSNIVYDYDELGDRTVIRHTAYAALVDKTAVCQGYACLLYRFLTKAGIPSRIVSGEVKDGGAHAWNIIGLVDKYYMADSTWDASYYSIGHEYKYFLKGLDDVNDYIIDSQYLTGDFAKIYPISKTSYVHLKDSNVVPIQVREITTKVTKPGKAKVTKAVRAGKRIRLTLKKVNGANGYQIKYSQSQKFKSSKTKSVNTKSVKKVLKSIDKKKYYYVKARAYKTVNNKKYYGLWSKTKKVKK